MMTQASPLSRGAGERLPLGGAKAQASIDKFLDRLSMAKNNISDRHYLDFNDWKKKNKIAADVKAFIVTGGYRDLKEALRKRGWVEPEPGFELLRSEVDESCE